jgi:SSS family solute:Na+ symporter
MRRTLQILLLALFARRLWSKGLPIWDVFAHAYGAGLQRPVALLSLVWMAGVLAAQIHGGVAVMQLLGLADLPGLTLVLTLLYGASRLDLRFAAGVFALCLSASALVLVYAIVSADGMGLYLRAVPEFMHDLSGFQPQQLWAILLAVSLLVCMGADYQQFVLAARTPWAAATGCALAAVILLAIGFLPSTLVVTMVEKGALGDVATAKQVVPLVLAQVAGTMGAGADTLMLVALSLAALGSGAAILRAMTDALVSAVPSGPFSRRQVLTIVALLLGASLAAREQGIVATMVSVNVVYIASIGVCFVALMMGVPLSKRHASAALTTGFLVSSGVQLAVWAGWTLDGADILALTVGLAASLAASMLLRWRAVRGWVRASGSSR